ncbi:MULTISPECIES: HYR domain-containing protein [Flavobacterium]|uniref:HYR domain-containing protein n=1 Tax=Flavobacterium TaxID=237 RepID=UPI001FCBEFCD|nr:MULTISPECIES: HYR domain-containing protein [Flavobacterium]UOK43613.1 HYR domain-containing protein [Flavobacterium enshiense]
MKKNILLLDPGPDIGTGSTSEPSNWFVFLKECSKCIKRNTLRSLAVLMLILFSNQLFAQHFGGLRTAVAVNVQQKDPINPVKKDYERFVLENNKFYKESSYSITLDALVLEPASTPCLAHRWDAGDGWRGTGNTPDVVWTPTVTPQPSDQPKGIVRCASSAETESQLEVFKGTYDASQNSFLANALPQTDCFSMKTEVFGNPLSDPTPGEEIVWFNFDIRPLAGTYQFQIVTNENVGFALFYVDPDFAQPVPGTGGAEYPPGQYPSAGSGDCTRLVFSTIDISGVSHPACGFSGNGWTTITVPSFKKPTNYYLAMWMADASATTFPNSMNLVYKSRFGCGGATCTLQHLETQVACSGNNAYTACLTYGGSAGRWFFADKTGSATGVTCELFDQFMHSKGTSTSPFTLGTISDSDDPINPANNQAVFAKICATYPIGTGYDIEVTADATYKPTNDYITCADGDRRTGSSPELPTLTLTAGPHEYCASALSLNLNSFVSVPAPVPAGYTLTFWTNANPSVQVPTPGNIDVTQTTSFIVRLTNDATGCSASQLLTITINPNPTASAEHTPISCFGGTSTLTVTGSGGTTPYTYSINDVDYFSTNTFTVPAGTYTVYVKDDKGCKDTDTEEITEPPADQPDIEIGPGSGTYCGLTQAQAEAQLATDFAAWLNSLIINDTGTLPYTIVTNPDPPLPPPFNGGEVTVSWTITDACGKSDTVSNTFTIGDCTIQCRLETDRTPCNVAGEIRAFATNGIPEYTFYLYKTNTLGGALQQQVGNALTDNVAPLDPGSVTFTGLAAGFYAVLVTDAVQNLDNASRCNIEVVRDSATPVVEHCGNDQITACLLTQAAINADYLAWFNSLAPTGGTNLEYHIVVRDAQNNIVDEDGIFAPARCGAVYTATVTYEDDCGQNGDCTGTYTVIGDTEDPAIVDIPDYDLGGCNTAWPTSVSTTFTDNCGVGGLLSGNVPGVLVDSGNVDTCTQFRIYRFSVTDDCGNDAEQTVRITRRFDETDPIVADVPDYDLGGCNTPWPTEVSTTFTDNCGAGGQTSGNVAGVLIDSGNVDTCNQFRIYRFRVIDDCGNDAEQTVRITRRFDETDPIVADVPDYDLGGCNTPWPTEVSTTFTDNCGAGGQTSGNVAGVLIDSGNVDTCNQFRIYRFRVIDDCGNDAEQTVRITRRFDETDPIVVDVPDYDLGGCNTPWPTEVSTTFTDNCGAGGQTSGNVAGVLIDSGNVDTCNQFRIYRFRVIDDCGNDAEQTVRITRRFDETDPIVVDVPDYDLGGCNTAWPTEVSTTFTDNCGAGGQTSGNVAGVLIDSGNVDTCNQFRIYRFRVIDDCGNDAEQTVRITRRFDETDPIVVDVPDYDLGGCNTAWPTEVSTTFTDNCGAGGQTSGNVAGVLIDSGNVDTCNQFRIYRFRVIDDCGNDAEQTVRITRRFDETDPIVVDVPDYDLGGCNTAWPTSVSTTFTDNCGVGASLSGNVAGVLIDSGNVNACTQFRIYRFRVIDDCGNDAEQTVRITRLFDETDPVIACPSNISQRVCDTFTPLVVPTATDNCDTSVAVVATRSDGLALNAPFPVGQTITVTYTATDDCGNDASCNFTVLLTDCGKACTPGFWKNHKDLWDGQNDFTVNNMPGSLPSTPGNTFITTTNFWTYFNIPVNTGGISNKANLDMLGATALGGGGCKALARHGVSALLGAAAFPGEYPYPAGTNSFATLYNLIRNSFLGTPGYPTCDQLAVTLANINNLDGPFCSALSRLPQVNLQAVYTQVESSMFKAYPVPFKEYINVQYEFDYHSKARIEVYDAKGIFVMSYDDADAYFNKEVRLDVNFNQGEGQIFIIKVITDKEVGTKRIISKK